MWRVKIDWDITDALVDSDIWCETVEEWDGPPKIGEGWCIDWVGDKEEGEAAVRWRERYCVATV